VIYGGIAKIGERGGSRDCVVRNMSEKGAGLEFSNIVNSPGEQMSLAVARKGRSFLARIIWWRDNFVGIAFSDEKPSEMPESDLGERLRRSEEKKTTTSAPHQRASRRLNASNAWSSAPNLISRGVLALGCAQ
jgi:hypothetical protein